MVLKEPIIKIQNLEKTFRSRKNEVRVLENINLEINHGEIFGVIGLSGAGKSTLVRCINYLETPTSGEIIFDGLKMSGLSTKELRDVRRSMGMIFQQFNLLMQRTSLDNVCFPLEISGMKKSEARERARELLELVGLGDKSHFYPAQLSGGQKQRIAIARALATNPKVLLCDEATSALDPTTTQSILELIKEINEKLHLTVIIITHEMRVVEEICNRVAIIDKNGIAEVGNVTDVFVNPESNIAKHLIFAESTKDMPQFKETKLFRIIFDGRSSYEPVISNMVMECRTPVNIMFADTKNIGGNAVGQMVIQLPDDDIAIKRIMHYLDIKNIKHEEVSNYV